MGLFQRVVSFHATFSVMLLLLSLASCKDERLRFLGSSAEEEKVCRNLSIADRLMEERPDSALTILRHDSTAVVNCSENTRMTYAMLKTQADDKLYITHKSDSVIRKVVEYFAEYGNARQQAQAWYLLGRVSYDLHSRGAALSAFAKVLDIIEEDSAVCCYKSLSATWMGEMYEEKNMHKYASINREKAKEYAQKTGNIICNIYTWRDLGRSYSNLGQNKIAMAYYQKAVKWAKITKSPYLYNMVSEELAYIYIREGMTEQARQALSTPLVEGSPSDIMARKNIWAAYYESIGEYDSAVTAYKEAVANAPMDAKINILHAISSLQAKTGNKNEALKYALLAKTYSDTMKQVEINEYKDLVSNVEEKLGIQQKNYELASDRKNLLTLVLFILFVVILSGGLLFNIHTKRKKARIEQSRRIKQYWTKREEESQDRIIKNEKHIRLLEHELSTSSENISEITRQMKEMEKELLETNSRNLKLKQTQKSLMESELKKSDIYLRFHDIHYMPSPHDFAKLEDALNRTYDGFVIRLKNLYPSINIDEIHVCCMVKINLSSKEMCRILGENANTLGMRRKRLYKKITNKEGSAHDLDALILDL